MAGYLWDILVFVFWFNILSWLAGWALFLFGMLCVFIIDRCKAAAERYNNYHIQKEESQ